ncbi:hypothetical protein PLICRDRAFT_99929 [Plicaturopsis crispa FD-325 SS-3]|nr:hypothetical protein PLICRDRAFT_99929 [Plicaturopsis crispa FD-325 SS-3]
MFSRSPILALSRRVPKRVQSLTARRNYATVDSLAPLEARGPPESPAPSQTPAPSLHVPPLDARLLAALSSGKASPSQAPLQSIIKQYLDHSGRVLPASLPYESRPGVDRRISFDGERGSDGLALVAHCVKDNSLMSKSDSYKITLCSGFAVDAPSSATGHVFVTCAHTLEEIRWSPLLRSETGDIASGTYIVTSSSSDLSSPILHPVSAVPSALHRSDLLLLSHPPTGSAPRRTLPVSPYPVMPHTPVRAHFVTEQQPAEPGWTPWTGGTWRKWVRGEVLGYRDFAGREAQPGTYDALSHMLFKPLPLAGSSGGPIVDEQSGAVVGVMLGTRMDNRVEGTRGWGVPAETIFEMFSLPGLEGKH